MSELRNRVLLADDHPMLLEGLRKLLEPDFEIVGAVMGGRALLEAAEILRPDLVIADIAMPGLDGLEATRRLKRTVPGMRVLILSVHAEPSWVRAAFEAGACGYLTKASAAEEIGTAVREVLQGHFYVSPVVTRAVVAAELPRDAPPAAPLPDGLGEPLTPRELAIVHLVGQGLGNKQIAGRLGVSVATVRSHLNKVYGKLGSESRIELALLAARTGGAVM
ncbi:MAG: response regulator [Thermoanaerobaculia bacterium]